MLFDDLEWAEAEADAAVDAFIDAFFETPEGMRQQIVSLQQHNGLLIAQHERMEAIIRSHGMVLPQLFINAAREAGFYEPVSF